MSASDALKELKGSFLVFATTHLTMKAEEILKNAGIPLRLFPKPRKVISECGLVIKVLNVDLERAAKACSEKGVEVEEIIRV